MQYRNLKEKRFDQKYFRIGSVVTLESIVFYSTLSGWIILIFSIILGTQWGVISVGERIFIDPEGNTLFNYYSIIWKLYFTLESTNG